jgi:hypothetical protein
MSDISQVGAGADSNIVTPAPPTLIVAPSASTKKTANAKSKKVSVAKAKKGLTPEEEQALIANAKATLAALDAHGEGYLPKMLAFGEAAHQAKANKPHGEFKKWCKEHLNRSSSWVSTYRRMFEERAYLKDALVWARKTDHKFANCRSVERLLKVIAEFKAKDADGANDNAPSPQHPRKVKGATAKTQPPLKQTETAFAPLLDLLPPEVSEWIQSWATAAAAGDDLANEALATFKQACHSALREILTRQTSSALEVSETAPAAQSDHLVENEEPGGKADLSLVENQKWTASESQPGTTVEHDGTKFGAHPSPATRLSPANDGLLSAGGTPVKILQHRKVH